MKIANIGIILMSFALTACNKEKYFGGANSIFENFESIDSIDQLFADGSGNWKYYQKTESGSYIEIDTTNPHSGNKCLKIVAVQGEVSKSDIANNKMSFWEDDVVQITSWFYLQGTADLNYVFLFDIEESTAIGASPGTRFALDEEGYLLVERNKYGETTISQPSDTKVIFPRDKWVELKIEIGLNQKKKGHIIVWQDGVQIIEELDARTLPRDRLLFMQGTKAMYQSIQIGLTATTSNSDITLFLDDIDIKVVN
jgi:Polysaccharide lyase